MGKVKKYTEYGVVKDKKGLEHQILVYGELTTEDALRGVRVSDVLYNRHNGQVSKVLDSKVVKTGKSYGATKTLNFGWAICHPNDKFDTAKAVELCKKRFSKSGISTQDCRFLTDDMVHSILKNELQYIKNVKLPEYLEKWEKLNAFKCAVDNIAQACVLKYCDPSGEDSYVVYSDGLAKFFVECYDDGKMRRYLFSTVDSPDTFDGCDDLICCGKDEWAKVSEEIKRLFNIDFVIKDGKSKALRNGNEITGNFRVVNTREDFY